MCGLCGGAGASTLAYLLGVFATRELRAPVLVCDTGGPSGGLASYAEVAAARSLVEVAALACDELPIGRPYATAPSGLRVLATGPRFSTTCPSDGVELVLEHARQAHALTIVDCGILARQADQIALAHASHIAWVLPATAAALRRAQLYIDAVIPHLPGRQLVVARRDQREPKAALGALKAIARQRDAPLILLPHLPGLETERSVSESLDVAQVSLQAIFGVLER